MGRWLGFLFSILVGFGLGLAYGWLVNPVEYIDTAPDTLRVDYKADYILMVAETFHRDADLAQAVRRLGMLGNTAPDELVLQAMAFGREEGYIESDLAIMQTLLDAIQRFRVELGTPVP